MLCWASDESLDRLNTLVQDDCSDFGDLVDVLNESLRFRVWNELSEDE